VIEIDKRVFWMPYPNKDIIEPLAAHLSERFGSTYYYIWNLSEFRYPTKAFGDQVYEHTCAGYPNPPLSEIFLICKAIITWLKTDEKNVAILHCQSSRGRSALLASCLLCLTKKFNHPGEALTYFCRQTHARDMKILFPSQRLYMNFFGNIVTGIPVI
jgi:hypothetical protein